ncbi:hypothetical protein [Nocardia alni]|uniref:hypothetical protein n=1 Tax=Nocardia alni TaxID=2815723 RepID=UPI001C216318|nr:hypothetical protein [Nocardia alni]
MTAVDPVQRVHVWDHLVLPAAAVDGWLIGWRTDYLPAARERGLRLTQWWQSHAGPDTVAVDMLWEIEGVYEFYRARTMAGADASVARFWSRTDELAVHRDRRVLEPCRPEPGRLASAATEPRLEES